jgi:hypothetical protein
MVDRVRRDRFAELLRHFGAGRLTNDEFVDLQRQILDDPAWPDEALRAMAVRAWSLYDDTQTHRLRGRRALTREGRREFARWIIFLHSDLEYEWPRSDIPSTWALLANMLTLGWSWRNRRREEVRRLRSIGELDVWPFMRQADFKRALENPRLLSGGAP